MWCIPDRSLKFPEKLCFGALVSWKGFLWVGRSGRWSVWCPVEFGRNGVLGWWAVWCPVEFGRNGVLGWWAVWCPVEFGRNGVLGWWSVWCPVEFGRNGVLGWWAVWCTVEFGRNGVLGWWAVWCTVEFGRNGVLGWWAVWCTVEFGRNGVLGRWSVSVWRQVEFGRNGVLGRWAVWNFGGMECWGGGLSGAKQHNYRDNGLACLLSWGRSSRVRWKWAGEKSSAAENCSSRRQLATLPLINGSRATCKDQQLPITALANAGLIVWREILLCEKSQWDGNDAWHIIKICFPPWRHFVVFVVLFHPDVSVMVDWALAKFPSLLLSVKKK